jgi:GTP-binding protein Era
MAKNRTTSAPRRAGRIALLGRSNVGKSTLLNAMLRHPLAIVSPKPQTTRDRLLGIVRHRDAELELLDTPGLHRAQSRLGQAMNRQAREAVGDADLIVLVTSVPRRPTEELHVHPTDQQLVASLAAELPLVLVINKVDLLADKTALLPLIESFAALRPLAAVVPLSARHDDGVDRLLDELAALVPKGEARHEADALTDRPLRFFAAEYIRERILAATGEEVPHAVAVTIDRFFEPAGNGPYKVDATIHVERAGQKGILVGKKGALVGRIRTESTLRLEELTGRAVALRLWVRVTPGWRDHPARLAELGYGVEPDLSEG